MDQSEYESAKRMLSDPDIFVRANLAKRTDLRPELLYYLTDDISPEVRGALADNAALPWQADMKLAGDSSEDVRAGLAGKVRRVLPDLKPGEEDAARQRIMKTLEVLAKDTAARVRGVVAETLKDVADAPPELVRQLARDAELAVSTAVLRASPLLTDEDLLPVVLKHGQDHLRAVSARPQVSEAVSDVIVARGDDETLGTLLRNDCANLSRRASEAAVERAKLNPALHEVTVNRASLPPDLLNEMYFVVEIRLRQTILEQNARMDPALLESALRHGRVQVATRDGVLPEDYAETLAKIEQLQAANRLTPSVLAGLMRGKSKTAFLIALARLADVDFHTARQVVERRELDALAVVCRAADLDRALFLTCALVLLNEDGDALGKARSYAEMYAALGRDTAQRTIRFWRLRREAVAA